MPTLAEIQDVFAAVLLNRTEPVPNFIKGAVRQRADLRFAVYRKNVAAGLVSALAARFPVVKRLVGDEFFSAMAHAFATAEMPRSPLMLYYGEAFPAFIEGFAPAAPLPYLPDLARIEMARGLAFHAADAAPLSPAAFAALPSDRLAGLRFRLHPSLFVLASSYPVHSIWQINQDPDRFRPVPVFAREGVLVVRPRLRVKVHCVTHEIVDFIRALAAGATLGEAIDAAAAAEGLAAVIRAQIVIGFKK